MKSFLKVFFIIFAPLTLSALLVFYYSTNLMIQSAQNELLDEMRNKWSVLQKTGMSLQKEPIRHQIMHEIHVDTGMRITLVSVSGNVIDDSFFDLLNVRRMENHKNRPEIRKAIGEGEGYSIRLSATTKMRMVYYAGRLNNELVLRVAYPTVYLDTLKQQYTRQNLLMFLFLSFMTSVVSVYLARRVSLPIQKLNRIVENIESDEENVQLYKFKDPTLSRVAGIIYQIYFSTIKKQEQFRLEQEKLNYIFGILEEGIILVNHHNTILHFNQTSERHLNSRLKKGIDLIKEVSDPDVALFFTEILDSDADNAWEERKLKGRVLKVNIRVLPNEKLIVFFDITEEVKYERYKSELVGNISHELKTPLSMIQGYTETILDDPDIPEKIRDRFLRKIHNSSRRINNIIDDLLTLHKLESAGKEFKVESPIDPLEIEQDIRERFSDLQDKELLFTIDSSEIYVHYEHFFSVVTNLVDNGLKYSTGDTIRITITQQDNEIRLEIEDEGPALPPNEWNRIFERFYTVSRSRNKSGTGLGLPIIKHIAQLYMGSVTISSGQHNGNLFTVILRERSGE